MGRASLEKLERILNYEFKDQSWLQRGLTHRSYRQENDRVGQDSEQLEFLGDAVLNFVISERLSREFPDLTEGQLSRARARLVARPHLAQVAQKLRLGEYLFLGRGEEKTGGRGKASLLAEALEALIAALYRDGGFPVASGFIERFILPADLGAEAPELVQTDHKSALQEFLQAACEPPPLYRVIRERGPEHQKLFTVEARLRGDLSARGEGPTKKAAEQQAARSLLAKLSRGNQ